MSSDDFVFAGGETPPPPPSRENDPALTVSDLAFALKRTLEDRFGHVRLRGEVSKVNRHASGHLYLSLKDDKAVIDGVVWKGQVRGLGIQPQAGLEVIVTGKITSYPARSSYQIVIETMEPAGAGALLAQLERLKTKLADEGLFDAANKRALPPHPVTIGVITSPTGAVIRDILHRLSERWPCRVLVWPVVVQGEAACGQVSGAIRGFDALPTDGPIPRPDLIIVARGGGSVEDLWCFNDEGLARTVAAATLPIISAVGHETDTTLIDFVSDRRAPTPTGAAEIATPVRASLIHQISDLEARRRRAGARLVEERRHRLRAVSRGLPARPEDLMSLARQRLDLAASRLLSGLERNRSVHARHLTGVSARLRPGLLAMEVKARRNRLIELDSRLHIAGRRFTPGGQDRLTALSRQLAALDPARPKPGFARVQDDNGRWITRAGDLHSDQAIRLTFGDGSRDAVVEPTTASAKPTTGRKTRTVRPPDQGRLL